MVEVENFGPVQALNQGISHLRLKPFMTVRCYRVDGILIDCGLSCFSGLVEQFCQEDKVGRVYLTHHHEDHSGNAWYLAQKNYAVFASPLTNAILQKGFSQYFYQRLVWGKITPTRQLKVFDQDAITTEKYTFKIIGAPGHCEDQVVIYEPKEGWLFSGDAFLGEKIKYFRRDEDFAVGIKTLRLLSELPIDKIFCAHRPILKHGQQALQKKLAYLLEVEERVRDAHQKGYNLTEITHRVLGNEELGMLFLTAGDVTKMNIVRSILLGPIHRNDRVAPSEILT